MRCFVISLPGSVDRRDSIRKRFARLPINWTFYDAIDLSTDRNHYFHHCDDQQFLLNTGRTPDIGEIGCFASHLMLWRTCRLLNEPLVVFEDDASLSPLAMDGLRLALRHIDRLGFIRLQDNSKRARLPVIAQRQHKISYCLRYPFGSMAYVISPQVAHRFIEESYVFNAPLDVFIKRYWQHGQALYSLSPGVTEPSAHTGTTTISMRSARSAPVTVRLARWLRKRRDAGARAAFNLGWLQRNWRLVHWRNPRLTLPRSEPVIDGQVQTCRRQR